MHQTVLSVRNVGVRGLLGLLAAVGLPACGGGDPVTAPGVTGLGRAAAEQLLAERDLRWRYAGDEEVRDRPIPAAARPPRSSSGQATIGTPYVLPSPEVVGQSPPVGSPLRTGDVVTLELRGGTEGFLQSLQTARERIERSGVRIP